MFGMSIPTLDNNLAKIYEPKAPAPTKRLETLKAAADYGLHTFVAVAPTYPECQSQDMDKTLAAIKPIGVKTIFMEPINIRAENVERIRKRGQALGVKMRTEVFDTRQSWRSYATNQLMDFAALLHGHGLSSQMHLWPDKALATGANEEMLKWLNGHWQKISYWPR
jgi:DNA repair photolyase